RGTQLSDRPSRIRLLLLCVGWKIGAGVVIAVRVFQRVIGLGSAFAGCRANGHKSDEHQDCEERAPSSISFAWRLAPECARGAPRENQLNALFEAVEMGRQPMKRRPCRGPS